MVMAREATAEEARTPRPAELSQPGALCQEAPPARPVLDRAARAAEDRAAPAAVSPAVRVVVALVRAAMEVPAAVRVRAAAPARAAAAVPGAR